MKTKLLSALLSLTFIFGSVSGVMPAASAMSYDTSAYEIEETNVPLRLYYDEEASHGVAAGYDDTDTYFGSGESLIEAHPNDDWERWSIPMLTLELNVPDPILIDFWKS